MDFEKAKKILKNCSIVYNFVQCGTSVLAQLEYDKKHKEAEEALAMAIGALDYVIGQTEAKGANDET